MAGVRGFGAFSPTCKSKSKSKSEVFSNSVNLKTNWVAAGVRPLAVTCAAAARKQQVWRGWFGVTGGVCNTYILEEILMGEGPLLEKSKKIALDVIRLSMDIRKAKKEYVLTKQMLRSGTSIGANIREAFYGYSTADYAAKLQIALKECVETLYWMELLTDSGIHDCSHLTDACVEIKKILVSAIKKAKGLDGAVQQRQ